MKKRLCIHIGHYKTGTTALQVFLASNPSFLSEHGVQYSSLFKEDAKHSSLAFSVLLDAGVRKLMHGYSDPVLPTEMWCRLFDHVRASAQHTVIVSSEELIRLGEFEAAAARLQEIAALCVDIDITVIAYLRNPRAHLRSWYNQLVKMGVPVADFTSALRGEIERIHTDYHFALRPWADAFGESNLILRDYDRVRSGSTTLFEDFLGVLGLPYPEGLSLPESDPNPRIDDRAVELLRLMQNSRLPPPTIAALGDQAARYLHEQDERVGTDLPSFADVCDRIDHGLARIGSLGRSNIDVSAFRRQLPLPAEHVEQTLLTGLVLKEFIFLRMYVNQTLPRLISRVDALEAQLRAVLAPHERKE